MAVCFMKLYILALLCTPPSHIQMSTTLLQGELFIGHYVFCTYNLQKKPLFDGWVLGVLNINVRKNWHIIHNLEATMYFK